VNKVFLDISHGYGDTGTVQNGVMEADRAMVLGFGVQSFLTHGHATEYTVRMTPDLFPFDMFGPDCRFTLRARARQAWEWHADLFVSLHFDSAVVNMAAHGPWVAYHDPNSRAVADCIQDSLGRDSRWSRVRYKNYAVLRQAAKYKRTREMPAVLVEGGYLTNPVEAAMIRSADITNLALRIAIGIKVWFENERNDT